MNLKISYDHYIVINDGQVTGSNLPGNVSFDHETLTLSLGAPITLHVIVILTHDYTLHYHVGAHTKAEVIETRIMNADATLTRDFAVDENASFHLFNENGGNDLHTQSYVDTGTIAHDANVEMGYAELSEAQVNADYHYHLTGVNASMHVRMAILAKDEQRKKYRINIEHNAPHTTGVMDNYGVAKDRAHLDLDGLGTIKKGNNGSESHQTNKIMVFDPTCFASANPYLFIDEYDVAASHAAAVGRMDEEHLYYLQSRGLTKRQAMQLITYGYLKPVIEIVDNENLKERFEEALTKVGA